MADRGSPLQSNYPIPEDFVILAKRVQPDAIHVMLAYVWQGYDRLRQADCLKIRKNESCLEDEITFALHARIQDVMHEDDPFSPFAPLHQPLETEHKKDKGSAPRCDLGFRLIDGNVRSRFSIEAKIIMTDGAVSEYVREINDNLLTGRYSTFSSEAAMLGYLLSGTAAKAFCAIAKALQCKLTKCTAFLGRDHRCSSHRRNLANTSGVTGRFRCHHMLMRFG